MVLNMSEVATGELENISCDENPTGQVPKRNSDPRIEHAAPFRKVSNVYFRYLIINSIMIASFRDEVFNCDLFVIRVINRNYSASVWTVEQNNLIRIEISVEMYFFSLIHYCTFVDHFLLSETCIFRNHCNVKISTHWTIVTSPFWITNQAAYH